MIYGGRIMAKYRKKPVVIEAMQWKKGNEGNLAQWLWNNKSVEVKLGVDSNGHFIESITIKTLEGDMKASLNDYIIKGVDGEFYPCKPDIFEKTYELVREEE